MATQGGPKVPQGGPKGAQKRPQSLPQGTPKSSQKRDPDPKTLFLENRALACTGTLPRKSASLVWGALWYVWGYISTCLSKGTGSAFQSRGL